MEGGGPSEHDDVVAIMPKEMVAAVPEEVSEVCCCASHPPFHVADAVRVEVRIASITDLLAAGPTVALDVLADHLFVLELLLELAGGEKCFLPPVLVPRPSNLSLVALPVLFDGEKVSDNLLPHITLRLVIFLVVVHRTDD